MSRDGLGLQRQCDFCSGSTTISPKHMVMTWTRDFTVNVIFLDHQDPIHYKVCATLLTVCVAHADASCSPPHTHTVFVLL